MKKQYTKPDIFFEDFSLSAGIAGICEKVINTQYDGQCPMKYADLLLFTGDVKVCLDKVEDGSPEYNGLCYHVPYESYNVFNS